MGFGLERARVPRRRPARPRTGPAARCCRIAPIRSSPSSPASESSLEADLATSTAIADLTDGDPQRWASQVSERHRGDAPVPPTCCSGARDAGLGPRHGVGAAAARARAMIPTPLARLERGRRAAPSSSSASTASRRFARSAWPRAAPAAAASSSRYQEISLVAAAGDEAAVEEPGLFADISMRALPRRPARPRRARIVAFGDDDPLTGRSRGGARARSGAPTSSSLVSSIARPSSAGVAPQLPLRAAGPVRSPGALAITAVVELNLRRSDDAVRTLSATSSARTWSSTEALTRSSGESEAERQRCSSRSSVSHSGSRPSGSSPVRVAHDFNNLLAAISSYCRARRSRTSRTTRRVVDLVEIREAAKRGATLVRQLLLFSRVTPSDASGSTSTQIIREFESLLGRAVGEGIDLRLDLDPDAGCVLGVAGELEQVVMNLGVNARDAMDGHGLITITTSTFVVARRRGGHRARTRSVRPLHGGRRRRGHVARGRLPRLRAVLHHEGARSWHRARARPRSTGSCSGRRADPHRLCTWARAPPWSWCSAGSTAPERGRAGGHRSGRPAGRRDRATAAVGRGRSVRSEQSTQPTARTPRLRRGRGVERAGGDRLRTAGSRIDGWSPTW